MVLCLCQGVSDKRVRVAIEQGACTRRQVTRACGAGAGCGGCHETIEKMLLDAREPQVARQVETPNVHSATVSA